MNYNKVRKMDISNGPGVRVSVFLQGCSFHCKGCFNSETWDFEGGKPYTEEIQNKILEFCSMDVIEGLSILGGEPMHPLNYPIALGLAKAFKERFPNKTLWCWTGYLYEELPDTEILNYLDVLVDGPFELLNKDPRLKFCGSTNQRVIDVKHSIHEGKIVKYVG